MNRNRISLAVTEAQQSATLAGLAQIEGYRQINLSGAAQGLDELRNEIGGRWATTRRRPVEAAA